MLEINNFKPGDMQSNHWDLMLNKRILYITALGIQISVNTWRQIFVLAPD
jgi:hypothetical protein